MKHKLEVIDKDAEYTPEVFGMSIEDIHKIEKAIAHRMITESLTPGASKVNEIIVEAIEELDIEWDFETPNHHFMLGWMAHTAVSITKEFGRDMAKVISPSNSASND